MDPAETMWKEFVSATGVTDGYVAEAFAEDVPELATELALLVLHGPKRATAGVKSLYEDEHEPLPIVGTHTVVLDGAGEPTCIIRTTEVTVRRFGEVDERFAFDEGEGDRSLAWWRNAHIAYFANWGVIVDDDTEMVLERFELVWPR